MKRKPWVYLVAFLVLAAVMYLVFDFLSPERRRARAVAAIMRENQKEAARLREELENSREWFNKNDKRYEANMKEEARLGTEIEETKKQIADMKKRLGEN